jgi:hypothetical protein
MPNTFDAVPQAARARSVAFLEMDAPAQRLEVIMEEAQLHRGSLREQDGYTIPFREGGQVRIRIVEGGEGAGGLRFEVRAPNDERRDYIQEIIAEQAGTQLPDAVSLDWEQQD